MVCDIVQKYKILPVRPKHIIGWEILGFLYFCGVNPDFEEIDNPKALKQLSPSELGAFSDYLRQFLIQKISENGGHFAANLGVVELTVALHYVFNCPDDILIWDVGHQAYAHKILTERKLAFDTLRKLKGLSGFPKMGESIYDAFGTAHSSTSISAALGYAAAAKLQGIQREHIAVIGDGAMSAGQCFEALNNAAVSNTNLTIIINDNHMGIDPSQGALGEYLEQLDEKKENLFTDFGFLYFGPIDGHNVDEMLQVFNHAKEQQVPKIIHIKTLKGKGYPAAEAEQTKWHSTQKFDKITGISSKKAGSGVKFQDVFGQALLEIAEKNEKVCAVTPAMISGSSLHYLQEKYPQRLFDVGIAEQHAVTFSAGLAASGLIPVCCIYSTFLQRALDQVIHDVALQNLPVVFAIDRAGLVGEDGPTHHGVFDISFIQSIPGVRIISPYNKEQLRNALYSAIQYREGPTFIRYPRTSTEDTISSNFEIIEPDSLQVLQHGNSSLAVISYGFMLNRCLKALSDIDCSIIDIVYIKPLPIDNLISLSEMYEHLVVVEDVQLIGGLASTIKLHSGRLSGSCTIHSFGLADHFTTHGTMSELLEENKLSDSDLTEKIKTLIGNIA